MSRYTTSKQGIVVGSENIFCTKNANDEPEDYFAVLWVETYQNLSEDLPILVDIQTPAQQLFETVETFRWPSAGNGIGGYFFGSETINRLVSKTIKQWLNSQNIDYYIPKVHPHRSPERPTIYFKNIEDALWLRFGCYRGQGHHIQCLPALLLHPGGGPVRHTCRYGDLHCAVVGRHQRPGGGLLV